MDPFVVAVRQANTDRNWYAALGLALALPDICCACESADGKTSGKRYIAWADKYFAPMYVAFVGPNRTRWDILSGGDVYALRCAFLHQGQDDISTQKAQEIYRRFRFISIDPPSQVHRNSRADGALQLQVDLFCEDLCSAVEAWSSDVASDADAQRRLGTLLLIEELNGNGFQL